MRRTSDPEPLTLEYPPGCKPRPYQEQSAAMIAHAGKFLLLDDIGLGKTVSTILGIEQRRLRGIEVFPMVIVVPSWEIGDSWREHILRWAPAWGMPRMHGGPNRVQGITARNRERLARDIFITTYATARRDAADDRGPLVRLRAAAMVVDEVHWIRHPDAQQTRAVQRIAKHATTFTGLSGTPIVKDTGDLYPMLAAMEPASWPSKKRMKQRYLTVTEDPAGYGETIDGLDPAADPEFRAVLRGQWHRFAKADVLQDLPDRIWSVLRPEIPPEWRKAYDQMEQDWLAELPDSGELSAMDTLTRLTRLSQLASSAADVRIEYVPDKLTGELKPHQVVTLRAPSWKAEALLVKLASRKDQPTAVFSESRQLAMITGTYCEDAGLRTGYITGVGDGNKYRITRRTRLKARADFQAGKLDVIICTAGSGGTGITLTASNCAVLLQRPFQYDLAVQPEGRIDRIGAEVHDHLEFIDVVTKNSVDQRRREVLRDKAGQLGQFVQDVRVVRELLGGRK